MHPRFRAPMNGNPPRRPAAPYNRQWRGYDEPSFGQRPPFIPFSPPHVARRFPPVIRPNSNDRPPFQNNQCGFDSQFQRPPHAPFRCYRPENVNHSPCPDNVKPRLNVRPPGFPHQGGGNAWRGRGGFGRGMKRFPDRETDVSAKKKRKVKEKPPPESCRFYCETCDRGYQVEEKYLEHLNTHEHCGWDGCPYVAAAKLVQIHRDQQHRTGLAKKIWQLQTKEDIDKWIAERKKNYPTKDTVAKKERQQTDKIRRGEVLETKQFGRFHRGRGRGRGWHHRNQRVQPRDETNQSKMTDGQAERTKDSKTNNDDPLSFGITSEQLDSDSDKDIADGISIKIQGEGDRGVLSGALGSIMSSYSADSDTEQVNSKEKSETSEAGSKTAENKRRRQQKKRNNHKTEQNVKQKHQSLLEKLLANEIRHERNVLLQCIRYIVQHNFFQVSPMSELKSEEPATFKSSDNKPMTSEHNTPTGDEMTKKCSKDDNSTRLREEEPHTMAPPGEQDMEVAEEPTVEEVSDSEMVDNQPESPVVIQDVSDEALAQDNADGMKSGQTPDVSLQDAGDLPVVQDPEVVVIEDISDDVNIEELPDNNAAGKTPTDEEEKEEDMSEEEDEAHPIVQDDIDKPVVQDPPGTPVIQDITGFPKIKDLSDSKKVEADADDAKEDKVDDEVHEDEEEESSSVSSAGEEEAIVEDIDAPLVQDPVDTPIIQEVLSVPNIRDLCDSPMPQETSDEASGESSREASPAQGEKPIVRDDSEEPVVDDPSESPLIQDISNQLIIQDITDPSIDPDVNEEASSPDSAQIPDPAPIVQDDTEESTEHHPPNSETMEESGTGDTTDMLVIQDVSDQAPEATKTSEH